MSLNFIITIKHVEMKNYASDCRLKVLVNRNMDVLRRDGVKEVLKVY